MFKIRIFLLLDYSRVYQGTGKSSLANAIITELGSESLWINASMEARELTFFGVEFRNLQVRLVSMTILKLL